MISAFMIVRDEEEMLPGCLEALTSIVSHLDVVSVIDNGSCDATMDILYKFKSRLPIIIRRDTSNSHHGHLRTRALELCSAPWIFYIDADETFDNTMNNWITSGEMEQADIWDFMKWSTIENREHFCVGGEGPSTRLFRNKPGVHFPQFIHTHPEATGLNSKRMNNVLMFEHSACKSEESRWAKGFRYQEAFRQRVPGVGPLDEYIWRNAEAYKQGTIRKFDQWILDRISWGPL